MSLHRANSSSGSRPRFSLSKSSGGRPALGSAHRSSYNPIEEYVPPTTILEAEAADKVPRWKRIVQVFVAVVYCFLGAGIVFGYAALKPVLIQEGVYRNKCTAEEVKQNVDLCSGQEIRLNLMFTIAAVSTNVAALPIGTILDRYGPRVCGLISAVLITAGCLFFAFAEDMSSRLDGYIAGYLFLALGGPFVFISSFQLSNTFPQHSGLILALLTGAFDTSSAIFLFYRLVYTATGGDLDPKKFFLIYLTVPAFILAVQLFVMPAQSYRTVGELIARAEDGNNDQHDSDDEIDDPDEVQRRRSARRDSRLSEITALLGKKGGDDAADKEEAKQARSGIYGVLHGETAFRQIISPFWILIAVFTVVQMIRINYFVATIRSQYTYILQSKNKAIQINSFFDIMLPLAGVIAVPFIGLVLDNLSTAFALGMLVLFATTIGILGVLPFMWAAYINVILFCLYRPFYYTTVSDYCAKVFGFDTFGKVYGLISCLAGLFNFLQYGLDALTHGTFHNDPKPVNITLLCVGFALGVVLVAYVEYKARTLDRQRLEDEAEAARISLVPGADERVREDRHPVKVHDYGTGGGQQPH